MLYRFEIPGTLPTFNDYMDKCRANKFGANKTKQDTEKLIIGCIPSDAPTFTDPVCVYMTWIRPDARSDKDNVTFAKKFVMDALQKAGIIKRDSWNLATPYDKGYAVNKHNPRTIVEITDEIPPRFNYVIGADYANK